MEDYYIKYVHDKMLLCNRYSNVVRIIAQDEQEHIESAAHAFSFASACLDNYLDAYFPDVEVMV